MVIRWYSLDEHGEPVWIDRADTHEAFGDPRRLVAQQMLGDVRVSTVFLVLDHSSDDGDPVLWETMIFGGKHDGYQERYTSRAAALAGHETAVNLVLNEP